MKQIGLNSATYIKALIIDYLLKQNSNIIIGNEVMYGVERRMVDLIVLNDSNITAIEIKAQKDSFRRIIDQIREYKKIFSYIYIYTTENHLQQATQYLSNDIGIYAITANDEIKLIRRATKQVKSDKSAILSSIKTSYLYKLSPDKKYLNADEIRIIYQKKSIKFLQKILYDYFQFKIKDQFNTFLSEKGNITHIEDVFLLSFPEKTII